MKYTVIVADDEETARNRLVRLLGAFSGEFTVVAEAGDGTSAADLIDRHKPDLVFLDIKMPGLSGIDVALRTKHKPFVIFVTAYNEFALDAFKTLAVDYLLKPIDEDGLRAAVDKFKQMVRPMQGFETVLTDLVCRMHGNDRQQVAISTGNSLKLVSYDDIICFEADNKYTLVHTLKDRLLTETSLSEFERILPSYRFIRIHRKHIVNVKYIAEINKWFNRRFKIKLSVPFKKDLVTGRSYANNLRDLVAPPVFPVSAESDIHPLLATVYRANPALRRNKIGN